MLGLFKTLLRPDLEEDPERTIIATAANIIQVGEFQLLQLAYHSWYGEDMTPAQSDVMFRAYMLRGDVPSWARHYARHIISSSDKGQLDENSPDYHRYDHDYVTDVPKGVRHFCLVSMVLAGVLVGGLLIGHVSGSSPTSVLPPYFEADELLPATETEKAGRLRNMVVE
ncbi:hypothetical protein [Pelagibius sp. Alg239-R121]|uniref:hypothetical protein n=1 Tax=Pelagibius sp. Alg239-R121 TaxID=2993448 RepID=UPI0024A713B3|nr:hypothetical protein [Pelagibius sp. Alg239-R121]